jgi:hypothetical protein
VPGSRVYVTVYGGAPGEIGGNRILLEWPDRRWLLDFGMRFGLMGRFFEEFVQPRGATLGLRDYLRMGLIPPLEGLYRNDLTSHDPGLWARYRDHAQYRRVDGVDGVHRSAVLSRTGALRSYPEDPLRFSCGSAVRRRCRPGRGGRLRHCTDAITVCALFNF